MWVCLCVGWWVGVCVYYVSCVRTRAKTHARYFAIEEGGAGGAVCLSSRRGERLRLRRPPPRGGLRPRKPRSRLRVLCVCVRVRACVCVRDHTHNTRVRAHTHTRRAGPQGVPAPPPQPPLPAVRAHTQARGFLSNPRFLSTRPSGFLSTRPINPWPAHPPTHPLTHARTTHPHPPTPTKPHRSGLRQAAHESMRRTSPCAWTRPCLRRTHARSPHAPAARRTDIRRPAGAGPERARAASHLARAVEATWRSRGACDHARSRGGHVASAWWSRGGRVARSIMYGRGDVAVAIACAWRGSGGKGGEAAIIMPEVTRWSRGRATWSRGDREVVSRGHEAITRSCHVVMWRSRGRAARRARPLCAKWRCNAGLSGREGWRVELGKRISASYLRGGEG